MRICKNKTHSELKGTLPYSDYTLKGGALYIAIIISIVTGIILCMFILMAAHNQRTVTVYTQSLQLNYNLQSAFELAQSAYFNESNNNRWFKNSSNNDSIKIRKTYWGAYQLIHAQTKKSSLKNSQKDNRI